MFSCDRCDTPGRVDTVYVIANMAHYATWFDLPSVASGIGWKLAFNTGDLNAAILDEGTTHPSGGVLAGERSVLIFTT